MPLGLKIALTHLESRKRQTLMSLLGVMLGVAFFLAVSGLMRGSEQDFIKRLIDAAPHITVTDEFRAAPEQPAIAEFPGASVELRGLKPRTEVRGIRGYKRKVDEIAALPGLRVAPVMAGQVILSYAGKDQGVLLNGIEPQRMAEVSDLEEKIVEGSLAQLTANPNGIIIGRALAAKFNLVMGDNLSVSSPVGLVRTMKIVGLFSTGQSAIDEGQAYVHLKRAQVLLGRADRANKLILQLDDPYSAREVAKAIERLVGYRAQSWQEASENVLSVLFIRNVIMYSVVSAILIVASFGIFNIISTVVMEKNRDIAILKSMGFHARDIRWIFLVEGFLIGGSGSILGVGAGYGLMAVLNRISIRPPGMGETITLPIYWGVDQAAIAILFATLSAAGAAYFPARKAGRLRPVEILRGGLG